MVRAFAQDPLDHRYELGGQAERTSVEGRRLGVHDLIDETWNRRGGERPALAEELVKNDADGPHIGTMIDGRSRNLLGGHVVGRPHYEARLRLDGGAFAHRDPEIEDFRGPVGQDLDVPRLDVAMDDTPLVGIVEAAADLRDDMHLVLEPLGLASLHELRQAISLQKLHHDERYTFTLELPEVENRDDIGMLEPGGRSRLPVEPTAHLLFDEKIFGHHLDGHDAVENRITRLVDRAHRAAAQLAKHDVLIDFFGNGRHRLWKEEIVFLTTRNKAGSSTTRVDHCIIGALTGLQRPHPELLAARASSGQALLSTSPRRRRTTSTCSLSRHQVLIEKTPSTRRISIDGAPSRKRF